MLTLVIKWRCPLERKRMTGESWIKRLSMETKIPFEHNSIFSLSFNRHNKQAGVKILSTRKCDQLRSEVRDRWEDYRLLTIQVSKMYLNRVRGHSLTKLATIVQFARHIFLPWHPSLPLHVSLHHVFPPVPTCWTFPRFSGFFQFSFLSLHSLCLCFLSFPFPATHCVCVHVSLCVFVCMYLCVCVCACISVCVCVPAQQCSEYVYVSAPHVYTRMAGRMVCPEPP